MDEALVALDLGTTNVKGLLLGRGGELLAESSRTHPSRSPRQNRVEQSHTSWWRTCVEILNELSNSFEGRIEAVGLSGQMHGCVCLDADGEVVRPPIIWQDGRSEEEVEAFPAATFETTGSPAATGMMGPTLLWMRRREPDLFNRIRTVLLPKDYLRFRLTGAGVTDHSDAAGSLLYDINSGEWSRDLCSAVGLEADQLPEIRFSHEVTGRIGSSVSRQTGLPEGIPVVAGAGDTVAATLGSGVITPGESGYTMGTAAQLKVVTDRPSVDPSERIQLMPHVTSDRWILMGAILSGGSSLEWAKTVLNVAKDYEGMLRTVEEQSRAGSRGVLFLPYLLGERSPHMDPRARGAFVGLRSDHERSDLLRAVLEGVGFALRDGQKIMEEMGYSIDRLTASGGGAKNPFWRRILADVLGARILTTSVDQESAYGAGMLAAVGNGWYGNVEDVAREWVSRRTAARPDEENSALYRRLHELYRELYGRLKETNRTLSRLRAEGEL